MKVWICGNDMSLIMITIFSLAKNEISIIYIFLVTIKTYKSTYVSTSESLMKLLNYLENYCSLMSF